MKDPSRDQIERLRSLRRRVEVLNDQLEENLKPFLSLTETTFVHSPKPQDKLKDELAKDTVDVSTTATVLMAVSMRDACMPAKGDVFFASKAVESLKKLYEKEWASAGLENGNFFTTALTLRATGFLRQPAHELEIDQLKRGGTDPKDLLRAVADEDPEGRRIDSKSAYPITPALAYWLMDAAQRLSVGLKSESWSAWVTWASRQFHIQLSNVVSNDDAAMDPIALAMSACLIAKLRGIAADAKMATFPPGIEQKLPSREHLRTAISMLFQRQGASGVWPKYFPLFIYPLGGAANHCFTFELLEAVLSEFPDELIGTLDFLSKIETSVGWCEKNRLRYANQDGKIFHGWNSGSNLEGLRAGYPECWATAVVHMFLSKLDTVLTDKISASLLSEHGEPPEKKKRWRTLLGSRVKLSGKSQDVKDVLEDILRHWEVDASGKRMDADAILERKRSALLFGPPGTSKTSYVKHLAAEYDWTCVSINPSHFLKDGLEQIFGRANEIFADLMDLSRAVVFFDEMDPLVQKREADSDIHHQSLTTVLLPKLADLYKRNNVAFFMATNHIQQIDPAIRRPGRFDYLLFVGPPRWQDKFRALTLGLDEKKFASLPKDEQVWRQGAHNMLTEWTNLWLKDPEQGVVPVLDRFTYDEMKALLDGIRSRAKGDLHAALRDLTKQRFEAEALEWAQKYIVLWDREDARSDDYAEFLKDKGSSRG